MGFVFCLLNLLLKNYTISFFCALFLGFSENFAWGISTISCNEDFKGNLSVFGYYKFFQNLGIALCMLLRIFPNQIPAATFIIINIVLFVVANIWSFDPKVASLPLSNRKDSL